jgi:hypothetical protein
VLPDAFVRTHSPCVCACVSAQPMAVLPDRARPLLASGHRLVDSYHHSVYNRNTDVICHSELGITQTLSLSRARLVLHARATYTNGLQKHLGSSIA